MHDLGVKARTHGKGATWLTLALVGAVACGRGEAPKVAGGETGPAKVAAPASPAAVERAAPVVATGAEGTPSTAAQDPGDGTAGEAPAADEEPSAPGSTATVAAEEEDPVPGLLAEVKRKRTKDERALVALEEAEQAGASPKDLARAAQARGRTLYAAPERARRFFEWAAEKDPKYADPLFFIAKQYAMTGDVPMIKEYLAKVHERGGRKLLTQIEFDPTWEIVKDDPDVRALLK
jgi:hypothetical protein